MDEKNFDRIVNCPLCHGSLECYRCYWMYRDRDKYTRVEEDALGEKRRVKSGEYYAKTDFEFSLDKEEMIQTFIKTACPLCDGTGTALARVADATMSCAICSGVGSVETTIKLEIGARKERLRCSACDGSGRRTQQRIEIQTLQPAPARCEFYFPDSKSHGWLQRALLKHGSNITIDLEGGAIEFFAKWQPVSESYLRERHEKERAKEQAEQARQEAERAKEGAKQEAERAKERARQEELRQHRASEGLCLTCGKALGLMDKMSGRQTHKKCP